MLKNCQKTTKNVKKPTELYKNGLKTVKNVEKLSQKKKIYIKKQ